MKEGGGGRGRRGGERGRRGRIDKERWKGEVDGEKVTFRLLLHEVSCILSIAFHIMHIETKITIYK